MSRKVRVIRGRMIVDPKTGSMIRPGTVLDEDSDAAKAAPDRVEPVGAGWDEPEAPPAPASARRAKAKASESSPLSAPRTVAPASPDAVIDTEAEGD